MLKIPGGIDALFRQLTPLVLLALVLCVLLEPVLPGVAFVREHLGETFPLRFAVVVLGLYVLLLWGESLRLHGLLLGLLKAMRDFDGGSAAGKPQRDPKARLDAIRVLIAALGSEDAGIRATSRQNLVRLAGQDLGDEPSAWRSWLEAQEGRGNR